MGRRQTESFYPQSVLLWLQEYWTEPDPPRLYALEQGSQHCSARRRDGIIDLPAFLPPRKSCRAPLVGGIERVHCLSSHSRPNQLSKLRVPTQCLNRRSDRTGDQQFGREGNPRGLDEFSRWEQWETPVMRVLLGIVLGVLITVGATLLYDSSTGRIPNGLRSTEENAPIVNWDVVSHDWDGVKQRLHDVAADVERGWKRITG
jgi:hypothetical protein